MRKIILAAILLQVPLVQGFCERSRGLYVSVNPLSVASSFQYDILMLNHIWMILSDQETGIAIGVGYDLDSRLSVEARFSAGVLNRIMFIHQYQLGCHYYPFGGNDGPRNGMYLGGSIRNINVHYMGTGAAFINLAPGLQAGWRFDFDPFFIDIRLNQMLALASFSSIEYSSPRIRWQFSPFPYISPLLPLPSFNVGWKFGGRHYRGTRKAAEDRHDSG